MKHATVENGIVIEVHDADPSVPNGMPAGMASTSGPDDMQVGWVVHDGKPMSATDRDNLPHKNELAAIDAESGMNRLLRECLLRIGCDNSRLLELEGKASAIRARLKK